MSKTSETGARYEQLAAKHIQDSGLAIVTQNYRSKGGEIDLIAKDSNTIVFIEVKYRRHTSFGSAIEQVTQSKMHKLRRCAEHYIQYNNIKQPCRFDVIGISGDHAAAPNIDWIKNAF